MSHWSRADPLRRAVFVGLLGVIALVVSVMVYHAVSAERPSGRSIPSPAVVPELPRSSAPTEVRAIPPSVSPPSDSPLTLEELTAAYSRALSFVDAFANGRSDEPIGDRIARIRQYVDPRAIDDVLVQYQRVMPQEEGREICTFRSTATRWLIVTDRQASLIVDGIRRVESPGGSAEAPLGLAVTLTRETGQWLVTSAADPEEGNTGAD